MSPTRHLFDPSLSADSTVRLGDGIKILVPLEGTSIDITFQISVPAGQAGEASPKALVSAVEFVDGRGDKVPAPDGWFHSNRFGSFRYAAAATSVIVSIDPPPAAREAILTLAPWMLSSDGVRVANAVTISPRRTGVPFDLVLGTVLRVPSVLDLGPQSGEDWVPLRSATAPVLLPVIGGQDLFLDVRLKPAIEGIDRSQPRALLDIQWFDGQGRSVPSRGKISKSARIGEYRYVKHADGRANLCLLQPPLEAARGIVRLRPWGGTRGDVTYQREAAVTFRGMQARTVTQTRPARRVHDLRVAMVCDEFTFNSFSPEFQVIPLTPNGWREEIEQSHPDLFLCESAWAGPDSASRPWRGRVYASDNFPNENRTELFDIIEYCREHGIPTAFWNKEDPSHYEDRRHDFVRTALLFDHIFTTALECVDRYKVDYGHPSVHCLPFATQPRHFNPATDRKRTDEVVFAGSWYNQHPARCVAMAQIFDDVLKSGRELVIFNRHHGDRDPNHLFPTKYASCLRPAVSHLEMADLYKRSRLGLNINTETKSRTMFARRVFELMSSNTLVLSNYSAGMDEMFGEKVVFVDRDPDRLASLTDTEVDRIRAEALRQVLSQHTYRNRVLQVLDAVGIPYATSDERPAVAVVVQSEADAEAALRAFAFLSSTAASLLLVLHESVPEIEVRAYYRQYNRGSVRVVDRRLIGDGSGLGLDLALDRIVLTHRLSDLSPELLREVRLHSTYMDGPMTFAQGPEDRYSFVTSPGCHHIVRTRELVAVLSESAEAPKSYYAI